MTRTAFVTGAEGFIGSHLVRFLQAKGWKVVGGYQAKRKPFPRLSGLSFVPCDLRDGQRLARLLKKYRPTHVFHLGAKSVPTASWTDPVSTFEANIMGSLHLFEGVRYLDSPPVVVSACSSAEYGHVRPSDIPISEEHPLRPLHPYGISKVCLDLLGREYFLNHKIPTVNLRLFSTTGPGKTSDATSDFVRQLVRIKKGLQPPVIAVGNLQSKRAFLDVSDTVRAFYLAALRGKRGEAYNLCAKDFYTIKQILQSAILLSGVKVTIQQAAHLMRPSDERVLFARTDKFHKDTGWKPLRSLEQILSSMLQYWDREL